MKSLRLAVLATVAGCALEASAVAGPAPVALASTPQLVAAFDGGNWSPDAWQVRSPAIQTWLGERPAPALEQRGDMWAAGGLSLRIPVSAPRPDLGQFASLTPGAQPLAFGLGRVADGDRPTAIRMATGALGARYAAPPTAAYVDISMRPVSDSAAAPAPRLQPAIYTRPLAAPPAQSVVGPGEAPNIFGSVALAAGHTPEDAKWRRVADYVPSAAAGPWSSALAAARRQSARERLATVNAWVNHAIAYAPDVQNYGVADYWGTARESLTRGRGDCKDYAIAKMELLRALGVPSEDLYLVLVKDLVRRQDHAILAVRLDGRFVILDSGFDGVMDSEDMRDYRPILTFSGARTWVHGFRRSPDVMIASAAPSADTMAR